MGDSECIPQPGVYGDRRIEVRGRGFGRTVEQPGVYGIEEPPGKPLPNRADRRRWAREAARQLNRGRRRRVVAWQPGTAEES